MNVRWGTSAGLSSQTERERKLYDRMLTLYSYPKLFGVADNNGYGLTVVALLKLARRALTARVCIRPYSAKTTSPNKGRRGIPSATRSCVSIRGK